MCDLISIIVPVYKVEEYIEDCIKSIISQTYKNLEILLIVDGSPDNSGLICDDYAKIDSRIKVFHRQNVGVSLTRNFGIDISKGKYVSFVDSDDYLENDYIEIMYNSLKNTNSQLVISNYNVVTQKKSGVEKLKSNMEISNMEALDMLFSSTKNVDGYCWNKLFKADVLKQIKFRSDIKVCEDLVFIYDYLSNIDNVVVLKNVLYNYRMRRSSALNKLTDKNFTVFNALNYLYEFYKDNIYFKNFYFYFYAKYRKCLKKGENLIMYSFSGKSLFFDKDLTLKNKLYYFLNIFIPIKMKNGIIRYKQKKLKYFN